MTATSNRPQRAINGIRLHFFVGGVEYPRCPSAWIEARRGAPLSRASLTLPDPYREEAKRIAQDMPVEIRYGYRDETPASWKGTVETVDTRSKDQIVLGCCGLEKPLTKTRVTQAWSNETPEAIIRYAVGQARLEIGRIDAPGVTFPRFIASNLPVWALAEQVEHTCKRAHGLDIANWRLWVDGQGKANWGDFDEETGEKFTAATGGNLISHHPATDQSAQGVVETWIVPGLWHSQKFQLRDRLRGTNQDLRVLAIRHQITGVSARSLITYGVEHGKY